LKRPQVLSILAPFPDDPIEPSQPNTQGRRVTIIFAKFIQQSEMPLDGLKAI
jgi:hypothetical protein